MTRKSVVSVKATSTSVWSSDPAASTVTVLVSESTVTVASPVPWKRILSAGEEAVIVWSPSETLLKRFIAPLREST